MDLFLYHFYSFSSPVVHFLCDYILPVGTVSCVLFDLGAPCVYYVCILFYRSPRSPSHSPSLSLSFFKYGVSVSCYFYIKVQHPLIQF